jgi:hypothetical protein
MISKKYKTPLYGTPFTIIIYNSEKEFNDKFKDDIFDPPIYNCDGAVFERKDQLYIVFSAEKKGYPTPGIIAHEAKHLVNSIFLDIGYDLDRYNDEPEDYLLGWIVNRIHEILPK